MHGVHTHDSQIGEIARQPSCLSPYSMSASSSWSYRASGKYTCNIRNTVSIALSGSSWMAAEQPRCVWMAVARAASAASVAAVGGASAWPPCRMVALPHGRHGVASTCKHAAGQHKAGRRNLAVFCKAVCPHLLLHAKTLPSLPSPVIPLLVVPEPGRQRRAPPRLPHLFGFFDQGHVACGTHLRLCANQRVLVRNMPVVPAAVKCVDEAGMYQARMGLAAWMDKDMRWSGNMPTQCVRPWVVHNVLVHGWCTTSQLVTLQECMQS
eukprot:364809-Chlamydomonas_euryale.AAC.26